MSDVDGNKLNSNQQLALNSRQRRKLEAQQHNDRLDNPPVIPPLRTRGKSRVAAMVVAMFAAMGGTKQKSKPRKFEKCWVDELHKG